MATNIVLRSVKAAALIHAEMDQNWESLARTVDSVVADKTIDLNDQNKILESDYLNGVITLPTVAIASAAQTDSFIITVKNIHTSILTLNAAPGEFIEGNATMLLLENESVNLSLSSNKSEWSVTSFYGQSLVGIVATPAEINKLSGMISSTIELNHSSGVTSSIQPQLNTKLISANNLSDLPNKATSRNNLGVDASGIDNSTPVTLAGTPNYLSIAGQVITRLLVNLASHVTGLLAEANLADDIRFTETFIANGTFTAPKTGNYTVTLVGGGGGGGGSGADNAYGPTGAEGGVRGQASSKTFITTLTGGVGYPVVIGGGGSGAVPVGGESVGNTGSPGGASTFNSLSSLGGPGGLGGLNIKTPTAGEKGESGKPIGVGGAGGAIGSAGGSALSNSGSGGGGGGGVAGGVSGTAGGNGGSGIVIISW